MITTHETYKDGVLIDTKVIDIPDEEVEPMAPETVIASIAAMTDGQKTALREALGL